MKAFGKSIIFQFEDKTRNGYFEQTNEAGIYVPPSHEDSTEGCRWATAVCVGPDVVSDVTPGTRIYIEALKWTEKFTVDGESYWKTDDSCVIAVSE